MAAKIPASRRPMTPIPQSVRARVFIRTEKCKGCRFCIEFCPNQALQLSTQFNAKGYHYPVVVKNACINCSLCTLICPDYAIFSLPANCSDGAVRRDKDTAPSTRPPAIVPDETAVQWLTQPKAPSTLQPERAACGVCMSQDTPNGNGKPRSEFALGQQYLDEESKPTMAAAMATGERIAGQGEVRNER